MRRLRTIHEWEKELHVKIKDPDGFDRADRYLHEKLFTRDEFLAGMMRSTCEFTTNASWSGVITNKDMQVVEQIALNLKETEGEE